MIVDVEADSGLVYLVYSDEWGQQCRVPMTYAEANELADDLDHTIALQKHTS